MVFSSAIFLFAFLPIVFIINYIIPSKYRNFFLLSASLLFYAWGEPVFVLLMLLSITVNYFMALKITSTKKTYLVISIVFNLTLLVVFKYSNFITQNLTSFLGLDITPTKIPLPIGISFFTFQAMSYVIDVYRNTSKAEKNIMNVALYISFFPQLIAGPIIKHHDIAEQIKKRSITVDNIYSGMTRFIVGLSKKLLIANVLGEAADIVFKSDPNGIGTLAAWLGAIAYTLQIYFDFSGYSDMAIGLGRMFGFEFKENFNFPFISSSMNEFWKRWHISLTNWFREYLYFPLGGNRKGRKRTYINLLIVFFCTGFWHGAEWTFILWGLSHGFFMLLEKTGIFKSKNIKFKFPGNIYTLFVVVTTFTIFRSPNISYSFSYLGTMFTNSQVAKEAVGILPEILSPLRILMFFIGIAASLPLLTFLKSRINDRLFRILGLASSIILLIICSISLAGESFNPFIYFRF